MPLQATSGAASYDGFGGGVVAEPNYIESCFSTYLYTGNATTGQSINNGIDLATKGGLLWCKNRTTGSTPHYLFDTTRDFSYTYASSLNTASTAAETGHGTNYAKPETTGFSFGDGAGSTSPNKNGDSFVSWTFRKQPKFFDVVTWTGDGQLNREVAHNLTSVPGFIAIKRTDSTGNWMIAARKDDTNYIVPIDGGTTTFGFNSTNSGTAISSTSPAWITATTFKPVYAANAYDSNLDGATYVAYLFAHDAGGFGLTGTDNVISCGSYTTNGSGVASVTLGYEPQWILWKRSDSTSDWYIFDTMRGWTGDPANTSAGLRPNLSNAENNLSGYAINATGFNVTAGAASATYIYIAIRRGPMKVPTSGTSVFSPIAYTGTSVTRDITGVGFPLDMNLTMDRATHTYNVLSDRLRSLTCDGVSVQQPQLRTNATDAEALITNGINGTSSSAMGGYTLYNAYSQMNASPDTYISYNFRRAPSFFDVVCYTGNSTAGRSITHNLAVIPEMLIVKGRSNSGAWQFLYQPTGIVGQLQSNDPLGTGVRAALFGDTTNYISPTSSVFTVGSDNTVNGSARTYVAYLFATCAGVSKVFSYTGNGSSQTINCGFTGGARFVLIKRTDSGGEWYVWDSARGIVAGNDPHLSLNDTAAEVTTDDSVDTDNTGFIVNQLSATDINVSSATYIGLAIA